MKELSPELVEKARIELNEIPDQVPRQIQQLRERIQADPKLNFKTDDAFLLRFLRARKFNEDRTFELMKNYYKQRLNYPGLFAKLSTTALKKVLDSKLTAPLLERDQHGRAVIILEFGIWDPTEYNFEDITAYCLLTMERLLDDEAVQINGIVVLIDMTGLRFSHIIHATPSLLKQFFTVTQNAFPIRYKQINFINQYFLFDVLFMIAKPFLSRKIRSRIAFRGTNIKSLHEEISSEILPQEFGGPKGPFDNSDWNKILEENDSTIKKDLEYGFVK